MAAVDRQLVRRDDRLVLLFTPPFERTTLDPGYIKGYPPGIRENGGQYTHGAVWSVIAFAMLGDGDRAAELFSLLNPIPNLTNLPWAPSPQSISTTCPSLLIATEGRLLLFVGVAELVPRNTTSSFVSP